MFYDAQDRVNSTALRPMLTQKKLRLSFRTSGEDRWWCGPDAAQVPLCRNMIQAMYPVDTRKTAGLLGIATSTVPMR
jgi:hypothetical protein